MFMCCYMFKSQHLAGSVVCINEGVMYLGLNTTDNFWNRTCTPANYLTPAGSNAVLRSMLCDYQAQADLHNISHVIASPSKR